MCGARPLCLSVGLILEEGLPFAVLRQVLASMRGAAEGAGVHLVTGDTKVVDRGHADGLYVNTAGIGRIIAARPIGPASIAAGDALLLSGDIGRHGMAVMAAREGLGFEPAIDSDCAPLAAPVLALLEAGIDLHCLRDLTRGGLASAAVELAAGAGLALALEEAAVPVRADVAAACELLGLDPLHVANEGRFLAVLPQAEAARALAILRGHPVSAGAALVGEVRPGPAGRVTACGPLGVERIVDMLSGDPLPRIC